MCTVHVNSVHEKTTFIGTCCAPVHSVCISYECPKNSSESHDASV